MPAHNHRGVRGRHGGATNTNARTTHGGAFDPTAAVSPGAGVEVEPEAQDTVLSGPDTSGDVGGNQIRAQSIDTEHFTATASIRYVSSVGANVTIDDTGLTILNGKLIVSRTAVVDAASVVIDGTNDYFRIASTGFMLVPKNSVRGDVFKMDQINTGITNDPYSVWTTLSEARNAAGYAQPLPEFLMNLSGQILRYFTGMAKHGGGGLTNVRGLKFTSLPPLAARTYNYWIYEQAAI